MTLYDRESWAAGEIPVFSYYQLLQSKPGGGDEAHATSPTSTTRRRWRRTGAMCGCSSGGQGEEDGRPPRRAGPLGLHRAARGRRRRRRSRVVPDGLRAAGFAQEFVRFRDELAPNVLPRLPHERLGHEARHPLREAARRHGSRLRNPLGRLLPLPPRAVRRLVRGFLGSGCRLLRAAGEPEHLVQARRLRPPPPLREDVRPARRRADGRVADPARQHGHAGREQHLGPLPGQSRPVAPRPRLPRPPAAYVAAGFVGFLFGRGADGPTCACDAAKDGVTNPAPIDGNTSVALRRRRRRLLRRAGPRYYRAGPLPLPR